MANLEKANTTIVEDFVAGAKKGFYIGVELIAPAMVLGFVLVLFLKITGLMAILGKAIGPVMAIFGLPGEAIVVLIAAFFAKAAGAAAGATLYGNGLITAAQATILLPGCMAMGTLIGHFVRIVIVSQANKRWHMLLLAIPIFDAIVVMLLTRVVLRFMGYAV